MKKEVLAYIKQNKMIKKKDIQSAEVAATQVGSNALKTRGLKDGY